MTGRACGVAEPVVRSRMPTRSPTSGVTKYVRYGSSPRGAQAILLAAKALALQSGRANVAFTDIEQVAAPALRHRLILSFEGQADDVDTDDIIRQVLQATPKTQTV